MPSTAEQKTPKPIILKLKAPSRPTPAPQMAPAVSRPEKQSVPKLVLKNSRPPPSNMPKAPLEKTEGPSSSKEATSASTPPRKRTLKLIGPRPPLSARPPSGRSVDRDLPESSSPDQRSQAGLEPSERKLPRLVLKHTKPRPNNQLKEDRQQEINDLEQQLARQQGQAKRTREWVQKQDVHQYQILGELQQPLPEGRKDDFPEELSLALHQHRVSDWPLLKVDAHFRYFHFNSTDSVPRGGSHHPHHFNNIELLNSALFHGDWHSYLACIDKATSLFCEKDRTKRLETGSHIKSNLLVVDGDHGFHDLSLIPKSFENVRRQVRERVEQTVTTRLELHVDQYVIYTKETDYEYALRTAVHSSTPTRWRSEARQEKTQQPHHKQQREQAPRVPFQTSTRRTNEKGEIVTPSGSEESSEAGTTQMASPERADTPAPACSPPEHPSRKRKAPEPLPTKIPAFFLKQPPSPSIFNAAEYRAKRAKRPEAEAPEAKSLRAKTPLAKIPTATKSEAKAPEGAWKPPAVKAFDLFDGKAGEGMNGINGSDALPTPAETEGKDVLACGGKWLDEVEV